MTIIRMVMIVLSAQIVALAGAMAGAGLLIFPIFYSAGYALYGIECEDPQSLVNRSKRRNECDKDLVESDM